jgi:hypothetical protein
MAYTGDIAARPGDLGCFSSWDESQTDNVVKTPMDDGTVKYRRRFTGINRRVSATVRLPAADYPAFVSWYNVAQRQGSIPTYVKTPYGTEEVFQFMAPPVYSWVDRNVVEVTVNMYQGANW